MKAIDCIVGKEYVFGEFEIKVTENGKGVKGIIISGEHKGKEIYQEHGGFCSVGKHGTGCEIHGNDGCIEIKEL